MQINVTYDASVDNAPAAFKTDVQYVVDLLDHAFTNDVTLNIHVGWGEVGGSHIAPGDLGESEEAQAPAYTYDQIVKALQDQAALPNASADLQQAAQTFAGLADPTNGGTFDIGTAEAKAFGLLPAHGSKTDGWIGFDATASDWSYGITDLPAANKYYLVGTIEHEITEIMGRDSLLGVAGEHYDNGWGVPDLFRFSAPGVRQLAPGPLHSTGYFSIDNGMTILGVWNNHAGSDFGDWNANGNEAGGGGPGPFGNDAFNDFSDFSVLNQITNTDLTLMHVLGWEAAQPLNEVINGEMYFVDAGQVSNPDLVIDPGGSLEVAAGGKLSGPVTFNGPGGFMEIDGPNAPANIIKGFVAGDTIDFFGAPIGKHPGVTLLPGNVLEIVEHNTTYDFKFDHNQDFTGQTFDVTGDGFGGTLIFIAPSVQSVATSGAGITNGSGDLDAGHVVTLTLDMNEAVNIDTTHGTPTLSLNDGGVATYSGGSGTNLLTFTYTVAKGENTSDLAISAFNLNGATAQDNNGHDADFSGAVVNPAGTLQIDTTPPHVTGASPAFANGSLEWVFSFDEPVTATAGATILWGELTVDTAATAALHDPTKLVFGFNGAHGFDFASAPANYSDGITDLAGNAPVPHSAPLPPLLTLVSIIGEAVDHVESLFHWPLPASTADAGPPWSTPAFDLPPPPPVFTPAFDLSPHPQFTPIGSSGGLLENIENAVHTALAPSGPGQGLFHLLV